MTRAELVRELRERPVALLDALATVDPLEVVITELMAQNEHLRDELDEQAERVRAVGGAQPDDVDRRSWLGRFGLAPRT